MSRRSSADPHPQVADRLEAARHGSIEVVATLVPDERASRKAYADGRGQFGSVHRVAGHGIDVRHINHAAAHARHGARHDDSLLASREDAEVRSLQETRQEDRFGIVMARPLGELRGRPDDRPRARGRTFARRVRLPMDPRRGEQQIHPGVARVNRGKAVLESAMWPPIEPRHDPVQSHGKVP